MFRIIAASLCLIAVTAAVDARPVARHTQSTAPATEWTKHYEATAAGGILRGNPRAPVKLVEYFSPSCSHCKHFADESHEGMSGMIATGKLSLEMRPLLLGAPHEPPLDVLIGCGTPAQGAALTDVFFAKQSDIFSQLEPVFRANAARWQKLPITDAFSEIADKLGLVALAQSMGVRPAHAHECLHNRRNYDAIEAVTRTAAQLHVNATPSFFLNGSPLPTTITEDPWVTVKRVLDATLPGITWPPISSHTKGSS